MREPQNCEMKYCGFSDPKDSNEIKFEILGLKNLVKRAEERISALEQAEFLANLAIDTNSENLTDFFKKN